MVNDLADLRKQNYKLAVGKAKKHWGSEKQSDPKTSSSTECSWVTSLSNSGKDWEVWRWTQTQLRVEVLTVPNTGVWSELYWMPIPQSFSECWQKRLHPPSMILNEWSSLAFLWGKSLKMYSRNNTDNNIGDLVLKIMLYIFEQQQHFYFLPLLIVGCCMEGSY